LKKVGGQRAWVEQKIEIGNSREKGTSKKKEAPEVISRGFMTQFQENGKGSSLKGRRQAKKGPKRLKKKTLKKSKRTERFGWEKGLAILTNKRELNRKKDAGKIKYHGKPPLPIRCKTEAPQTVQKERLVSTKVGLTKKRFSDRRIRKKGFCGRRSDNIPQIKMRDKKDRPKNRKNPVWWKAKGIQGNMSQHPRGRRLGATNGWGGLIGCFF